MNPCCQKKQIKHENRLTKKKQGSFVSYHGQPSRWISKIHMKGYVMWAMNARVVYGHIIVIVYPEKEPLKLLPIMIRICLSNIFLIAFSFLLESFHSSDFTSVIPNYLPLYEEFIFSNLPFFCFLIQSCNALLGNST